VPAAPKSEADVVKISLGLGVEPQTFGLPLPVGGGSPFVAAMARARRFWIGLTFVGVFSAVLVGIRSGWTDREPARWFVPGPLGHEPGWAPAAPGPHAFLTRAMSGVERLDAGEWARRNQLTRPLAFSHALAGIFAPDLYKSHPEFFPWVDGKRLAPPGTGPAFWNPDIARADVASYAAEAARNYFQTHPNAESFALGVNDALIWGESPELLALSTPTRWFRERPDYSPVLFTFMNRVADEVAKTNPQKLLGTLAYYWTENVPPFPIRPNVVPFLTADRSQGYDPGFHDEELQLQERWAKSGVKRLGLYDYVYGGGFLIPRIHTRLLAENLRHARKVGFTDYYAEVDPNWGLDGPMPWLLAQLTRDPEQSEDRLLDEYYRRYFREAAGPMRQFFETCEKQWMSQPGPPYWLKHFRNESQAIIFSSAVCRGLRRMLGEAALLAQSAPINDRVRLVSDAFGVTERMAAFHDARDSISRQILGRGRDWRALAAGLRTYLLCRQEFIRYTDELRRQSPLAIAPFGWDDYVRNDPLGAALLSILRDSNRKHEMLEADAEISRWRDPAVMALWAGIRVGGAEVTVERNGAWGGKPVAARRIAGLDYGVSLPSEWTSRVEPSQFFSAKLSGTGDEHRLRVAGTKDTMIFQWNPLVRRGLYRGAVTLKGRVTPGTSVSVMLAWLDAAEKNIGFRSFRLPEGDWTNPVNLEVVGLTPGTAQWVGVGLRVQHQMEGDWIEVGDFQLRAK
jgi:hypothetical protein